MEEEGIDEGFEEMEDPTQPPVEPSVLRPHPEDVPLRRPPAPSTPVRPPPPSATQSAPASPPPAAASSLPISPRPSTSTEGQSSSLRTCDISSDSMPGYTQVEYLADYLYSLRSQTLSLTPDQMDHIVRLWDLLTDYDKQPTVPSPRHSSRLTKVSTSTYKARNKQSVVPGTDTVNRTIRGENEGPAQKPDANRIMACLIVKLCGAFPSPEKRDGQRQDRWTLVTRAYRNIRQLVLDSPVVMKKTALQLFNVNNATLTKWYNDRVKVISANIITIINLLATMQLKKKLLTYVLQFLFDHLSAFRVRSCSFLSRASGSQCPP
ncbi:hypothetical protein DPMN_127909 [Dreissena polymorpha]|uniref:Uncharacterized protein n=1 Tax=Dreissena polymorpha TaxID=45954 RepID=A0A9D4H218_DREPO|nr:hypothetical protein DPMN_127909 [Dreissena polymorpha]